jgi:hypothetical protein
MESSMTHQSLRTDFAQSRLQLKRRKLLWSCAAAAIATVALQPRPAHAQAFAGTPTQPNPNIAVDGSATRLITSPTTETITVATDKAIINWTPNDNDGSGPIDFLPAGNIATFTNDPNAITNFTVLNRIVPADPTRRIDLNGTVIGQLQDLSGNTTQGGRIWFYSPGGILVGATAVFNVGSLLLTANDPISFSNTPGGFTGNFVAGANSTASVQIDPGATINATPENSYVALVAPRVVQGGTVNVNGSAAYVGGEDVTLTMNQGLFDIAVNVGTSDPFNPDSGNGVVHTGTTGGPASTGAGDNHRIYMVAVPKNQALTMLLSGNAGFTPASSATLDNGTIVLAAGSNVAETSGTLAVTSTGAIDADLTIGTGNYTSDVRGFARGDIYASADTGNISFSRDVTLRSQNAAANGTVTLGATNGNTLTVGRNAFLQTNNATFTSGNPEVWINADGGIVNIVGNATLNVGAAADGTIEDAALTASNDGSLSIGGTTVMNVLAPASGITPGLDSADAFAGDITIEALNGGEITLHDTTLFASANGQDNNGNGSGFNLGRAGDGFGGNISISADRGAVTINGNLFASADGIGGRMLDGGLFGGSGFGGSIDVSTFDGSIHVTGNAFLSALGSGGGYIGSPTFGTPQGGSGFGGNATIFSGGSGFIPDPSSITIDGDTTIRADGTGGSAQAGGSGFGGTAGISGNKGTITLGPTATINVSARGTGGNANAGFGGDGGNGFGGDAFINALAVPPGVEQFASASNITGGNATIDVTGTGGSGGTGNGDNILPGSGGDGFGGAPCQGECSTGGASALASVDGGSLTLGNVTLLANGVGGTGGAGGSDQAGGAGGTGFGGGVLVGLVDSLFFPTGAADGEAHFGNILGFASGNGGNGGAGGSASGGGFMPQGDGGTGFGGTVSLWSNSLVTAASVTFFANGNGGNGGNGGSAFGGSATIMSNDAFIFIDDILTRVDGSIDIDGDVTLEAAAASGNGSSGSTGDASGGTAELRADGGDMTIGGDVFLSADGDAEDAVSGGQGQGGLATIDALDGANIAAASLTAQALGEGGNGTTFAGSGDGGTARVRAHSGGSITTGDLTVDASATGGNSVTGGDAFGGEAEASAFEPDSELTVTGLATVRANGTGGTGTIAGAGGSGFGGSAKMYAGVGDSGAGGATVTIQNALLQANGTGGSGGSGGSGFGGGDASETEGVQIGARLGTFTIIGTLTADADGQGGDGLAGPGGSGTGGNILAVANFIDDVGTATATLGTADLSALGFGGAGGGAGAAGGSGEGGEVEVLSQTAGSVLNATSLTLHAGAAGGTGGSGATGGAGGDAFGGHTLIDIAAGSANLGVIQSFARGFGGFGGDGSSGAGGNGGSGFGGFSEFTVNSTLNATSYTGAATGFGGDGGLGATTAGAGGFGGGSSASFDVLASGDVAFSGALSLSAAGVGGDGSDGGSGSGSSATLNIAEGGSLSTADLFVDSSAFGGNASSGAGGDASAGFATVANDGDLTVTDETFISADAHGGNGVTLGGSAFGGFARAWVSGVGVTTLGPNSEISADGGGGFASAGIGGDGIGGFALLQAFGGGTMGGGSAAVTAGGSGGGGLTGGEGIGGTFFGEGSGGAFIEASGTDSTVSFTGTLSAFAVGLGGNSSAGVHGNGSGGIATIAAYDGGSTSAAGAFIETSGIDGTGTGPFTGTGGTATLEAAGGTVSLGGATLLSHGSAEGGRVEINSTSNFGSGSGDLSVNFLTAAANGPTAGDIFVTVENGSVADLGVAQLTATGLSGGSITIDIGDVPFVALGGIGTLGLSNTVLTADSLALLTSGDIEIVSHNGASMDIAGTFSANAGGAITLDDIDGTAVARADIIDFDSNSFSSTFDLIGRVIDISTVVDLDVTGTILLASETLTLTSQADILAGDLSAGLAIGLFAGGDITAGDLTSGGTIDADAFGGITLGDLDSGGETNLDANGDILFGDADVGSIDFDTDGSVTGGNIVAVTTATGEAEGAVKLGNITVGPGPEPIDDFSVGIASATSIEVGNVQSYGRVGFATLGDLTTGNIVAGPLFLTLVSGDISTGSITTAPNGRVYMADSSMFIAGGGPDDFDPSTILDDPPVATGGSITIGGPVSTGLFQAAAGDDLTTAAITAGGRIDVSAGNDILMGGLNSGSDILAVAPGNITTGDITAAGRVDLLSTGTGGLGNIQFGDVTADVLDFSADGTVTGGDIVAVTKVTGDSEGAILLGNINVTGPEAGGDFSVGIASETSIAVGNVSAVGRVGFATLGDLTTGNIAAGPLFMALVSGDVTVGSVTTAPSGQVYVADSSMFVAAGGTDDFDASLVLPLAPVPTGGSITIGGPVSTGRFRAAAGANIDVASINAGQSIEMTAGNDIFTGDLDAGTTVDVDAGNDFVVANVTAGDEATFTAGGMASFLGLVSAPEITVTSFDINIDGQLGERGVTDLVTLNALSDGPVILIGGEDDGESTPPVGYWLADNEEVHSDTIVFNAVNAGEGSMPDVVVSDLEIEGTQTPGGGASHLQLNTSGAVLVEGLVLYGAAGASDLLEVNAGSIRVNTTAGGRIAMTNAAEDAPAGNLELNADDIWVGSEALLDQLNDDPNFVGRDDAIGTPGDVDPLGFLIAGTMTLGIGNTLFVQNSGTPTDFAGITVGSGGLTIRTTGEAPAHVVAYGRRFVSDGVFVTGNAFFDEVDFGLDAGSTYTDLAEFNECLINTGCQVTFFGGGPLGPESILGPVDQMSDPQETIDQATSDDSDGDGLADDFDSQLIGTGDLTGDELIDEGVTSGSDTSQWCAEDEADSDEEGRCK